MSSKNLVVIGGGAAGFFCAVNAARYQSGLKVTILEKSNKLLSKVKISGGGRCNVTHACFNINELIKYYPRGAAFLKKSFHFFSPKDTVRWFEERGITLVAESDGRMFPTTNSSQTIINCLLQEANKFGVDIQMNAPVIAIEKNQDGQFVIRYGKDRQLVTDYVCIAGGGFPKLQQYDWLNGLGHSIATPVPSLFTFNIPQHPITQLMGITVKDTAIKIAGTSLMQRGSLLITHWGLSGPAILKLSSWAARDLAALHYDFKIVVNWLPEYNENSLREQFQYFRFHLAAQKIYNRNPFGLPARLWDYFLSCIYINNELRWADVPAKAQNLLIKKITGDLFSVKGKTTFKEEFVTAGGIDLNEVDFQTMESKLHPRLYFAGEILNVDGVTGGFNFQNAWTTAWIAASSIVRSGC